MEFSFERRNADTVLTTKCQHTDGNAFQQASDRFIMLWEYVSEVIASSRKGKVLSVLGGGELDQRAIAKLCCLERSNAHRALRDLSARGMVECLTPERSRAKIYRITPLGRRVLARTPSRGNTHRGLEASLHA